MGLAQKIQEFSRSSAKIANTPVARKRSGVHQNPAATCNLRSHLRSFKEFGVNIFENATDRLDWASPSGPIRKFEMPLLIRNDALAIWPSGQILTSQ
jgi:hypothetical protein